MSIDAFKRPPERFDERRVRAWRTAVSKVQGRGWLLPEMRYAIEYGVDTFVLYLTEVERARERLRTADPSTVADVRLAVIEATEEWRQVARGWAAELLLLRRTPSALSALNADGFDAELLEAFDWPA